MEWCVKGCVWRWVGAVCGGVVWEQCEEGECGGVVHGAVWVGGVWSGVWEGGRGVGSCGIVWGGVWRGSVWCGVWSGVWRGCVEG